MQYCCHCGAHITLSRDNPFVQREPRVESDFSRPHSAMCEIGGEGAHVTHTEQSFYICGS
jgi:hypothetical protein